MTAPPEDSAEELPGRPARRRRRLRVDLAAAAVLLAVVAYVGVRIGGGPDAHNHHAPSPTQTVPTDTRTVPVETHIVPSPVHRAPGLRWGGSSPTRPGLR